MFQLPNIDGIRVPVVFRKPGEARLNTNADKMTETINIRLLEHLSSGRLKQTWDGAETEKNVSKFDRVSAPSASFGRA